ncbi:cytochrome P450 [Panus rudis PR-1116 ss-1]|nr:cytochrome P450 [Panus rudis PR-1116 ss-1]
MLLTTDIIAILLTAVVLGVIHYRKSIAERQYKSPPPGPPGYPIVGNINAIPQHEAWFKFLEWSRQYKSDVIGLRIFGTNIVVLNSLEAATELLDKRSSIYSDRPHMTMIEDLVGYRWMVSFVKYGEHWRNMRRAFHQEFNQVAIQRFRPIQVKACHELLRKFISRPETFMADIRHLAGRIIMRTAYGTDIKDDGDRFIKIGEESLHAISATTNAGSYLVDSLPILRYLPEWFPGAGFQREAKAWAPYVSAMLTEPYAYLKQQMIAGNANQCAATSLLEGMVKEAKDPAYTEQIVQRTLGSMYTGKFQLCTVTALCFFMLAMVLYPEVQKKAQKELDSVLGIEVLPNFHDRPSLPYIEAVVNETLRWHPVAPLNVAHRLTEDDFYNGYFLKEGSVVVANIWAILHDENVYPEPYRFNPDRFMKDGQSDPHILDPEVAAFGFGRRICPGQALANETLWIVIASVLAAFEITPAVDEKGEKIIPTEEFSPGLLSYPKPFKCQIRPRSNEWRAIVDATALD